VWHYQGALGAIAHDDITFQRNTVDSQDLFDLDTDLCILRAHASSEDFINVFKEGVDQYLDGDWEAAKGKVRIYIISPSTVLRDFYCILLDYLTQKMELQY
jgi:hypothetical protein